MQGIKNQNTDEASTTYIVLCFQCESTVTLTAICLKSIFLVRQKEVLLESTWSTENYVKNTCIYLSFERVKLQQN